MDSDIRMPLIRSSAEFGYLTRSRLSEDPKRLESPSNFKLGNSNAPLVNFVWPPCDPSNGTSCKLTEDIIKELSLSIQGVFPKVINSPYSFTDVKIMADEIHALAVTHEGYCVYVDITNNTFEEVLLSKYVLSLVLLCHDDSMAFVKEKDHGRIYCLDLPSMNVRKVLKVAGETNGIGKMCLDPDEEYLYARLWKGEIVRWSISTMGDYQVMLSDKIISCMNISPDGVVVIGTVDRRLLLFSLDFERIVEKCVDFIVDAYINFSDSGHLIILGMEKAIRVFEKETMNMVYEINVGCLANDCRMTRDNRYIIAALDTGQLAFFDTQVEGKELRIKIHESSIRSIHVSADQGKIYTFGLDCKLSHVKFPRLSLFRSLQEAKNPEQEASEDGNGPDLDGSFTQTGRKQKQVDEDGLFKPLCMVQPSGDILIAAGESNKIFLFQASTKQKSGELAGHQDYVFSLALLSESVLASGSADNSIMLWDFKEKLNQGKMLGHVGAVTALAKIDASRLASGSQDRTVKIWAWEDCILLHSINDVPEPVVALFVPRSTEIMVGTKRLLQCWHLQSYSLVFEKKCDTEVTCFRFAEVGRRRLIGLGLSDKALWLENPFSCQEITYWGPEEGKTYELLTYLREMMMGKIPNYDGSMDLWLISPYNINILHFYAYFNMPEYLAQSIANGTPLLNSVCNSNPLTISLEMKHKECVEMILKSAWKRSSYNPFTLSLITEASILTLNCIDTYLLPKFYRLLLTKPYALPKYCSEKTRLPVMHLSSTQALVPKHLLGEAAFAGNETEVYFLQSSIPLSLIPGSRNSIVFLRSFMNSKQSEVFATEFIQTVLQYKWDSVKWILFGEWLLFMAFFLSLIAGVVLQDVGFYSFCVIFGLGGLLTLFQIYYCILSRSFSCWTALDLVRSLLLTGYFLMRYFECPGEVWTRGHILLGALVLAFVQGLYYFQLCSKTRYIIRTAGEMLKESLSLVFLIVYVLAVAAVILYVNQESEEFEGEDFVTLLGLPTTQEISSVFTTFQEMVAPVIVFLVLLAVCTHSYEQSTEKLMISEYQAIAMLTLRGEYLMPWRRSQNCLQLVQVATHNRFVSMDKLKKVSKAVKIVKQEQDQHRYEISEGFGEIKEKLEALHQGIKEIKNEKRFSRKKN